MSSKILNSLLMESRSDIMEGAIFGHSCKFQTEEIMGAQNFDCL